MKNRFPWLTITIGRIRSNIDHSIFQIARRKRGQRIETRGGKTEFDYEPSVTPWGSIYRRFNLNCLFNPGMFIRLSKFQLKSSTVPDYAVTFQDPIKHSLHVAHRLTDFPGTMTLSEWLDSFAFLTHFLSPSFPLPF